MSENPAFSKIEKAWLSACVLTSPRACAASYSSASRREAIASISSASACDQRTAAMTFVDRIPEDAVLKRVEKRDCAVRDMWLACHTQDQIAAAIGMTQQGVDRVLQQNETFRFAVNPGEKIEIENNEERLNALEEQNRGFAFHNTEFEKPIYNIRRGRAWIDKKSVQA